MGILSNGYLTVNEGLVDYIYVSTKPSDSLIKLYLWVNITIVESN